MRTLIFFILIFSSSVAYGAPLSPFPKFDPTAMKKITGRVLSIQKFNLVNTPWRPKVQIILEHENQNVTVEMGPEWFLQKGGLTLSSSDRVSVTGSFVKINEQCFLIAQEIEAHNVTLKLRDEKGEPQWLPSKSCDFNTSLSDATECLFW